MYLFCSTGVNNNRSVLRDSGACEAVAQVLKKYSSSHENISQWACWAALNLCVNDQVSCQRLGSASVILNSDSVRNLIASAKDNFTSNSSVQAWCDTLLTLID